MRKEFEVDRNPEFPKLLCKENTRKYIVVCGYCAFFQNTIKLFMELFVEIASQLQACGLVFPMAVVY